MSKPLVFIFGVLTGIVLCAAVAAVGVAYVGKQIAAHAGDPSAATSPAHADPAVDLTGSYACDGCIYQGVEFREGGHAVVYGMGIAYPTTFTRAGDRVYVTTDKGDLGFQVVDATTLEGEGWAAGTYRRR